MNYYPLSISYLSLRRALASGIAAHASKRIKKFHCNCEQHNALGITAIVPDEVNEIAKSRDEPTNKICIWKAENDGELAIDLEGKILINAYEFYLEHPDWKVRAAVAAGLGKLNTERSIDLLLMLMADEHYGVANAAIQASEKIGSEQILNLMQYFTIDHTVKRIERLITRAVERIKYFVNAKKFVIPTLNKLLNRNLTRKVPSQKDKTNKLLVPRKFFHGIFTERAVVRQLGSLDSAARVQRIPHQQFRFNGEKLLVSNTRHSSDVTKKNKMKYNISLLFKNRFIVDSVQNYLQPIAGEVYWAVTDSVDPKTTRPVVILKSMAKKQDEFLVAPLTSDISNPKSKLLVNIDENKSSVQMSRQKIIHKSRLLNKYGRVSSTDQKKVLASQDIGKLHIPKIRNYITHSSKPFSKTKRNRHGKYAIDITAEVYQSSVNIKDATQEPFNAGRATKSKFAITLGQFFKPPLIVSSPEELIRRPKEIKKTSDTVLKPPLRVASAEEPLRRPKGSKKKRDAALKPPLREAPTVQPKSKQKETNKTRDTALKPRRPK